MTDIVERLRSRIKWDTCIPAEMIMEDAAQAIESLRQQLADAPKTCAKMLFDQENTFKQQLALKDKEIEAKEFINNDLQDDIAECQAREREKNEALRIVQAAICLAADDAPESTIGKLYDHVSKVVVMPSDSTALDTMLKAARLKGMHEAGG